MEFQFVPKQLIGVRKKVEQEHPFSRPEIKISPSDELRSLILRIVNAKSDSLELLVCTLDDDEVMAVVSYIPHNYYDVDLENLFEVFVRRIDKDLCACFYSQWQDAYEKADLNKIIVKKLGDNEEFIAFLKFCNYERKAFFDLLKDNNLPTVIGYELIRLPEGRWRTFEERLEYHHIQKTSFLAKMIIARFYTFCTRADYLLVKSGELLSIISVYDQDLLKQFVINFLRELEESDLEKYEDLALFFGKELGENYGPRFTEFFLSVDQEILEKYVDWINNFRLSKYFGNDERSVFWKTYRHRNVRKFAYSGAVVMEFPEYYAVEFLGKAMGPAYIYKKDYYERVPKRYVEGQYYGNNDLRQYLLHETSYSDEAIWIGNSNGTRLGHRSDWQNKFRRVIKNNHITRLRML